MKNLQDKVIAITGAGSGIGRALAIELAKCGSHLALSDMNMDALQQTQTLLNGDASKVSLHQVDVSQAEQVYAWADAVAKLHGKINVIINNAGVALSGTVAGLEIKDYQWVMDINFWGVVYGTKAFLPYLEQSGEGHIVNISSVFGLTAQPFMSGYNASKFAVRGFSESLRQDLEMAGSCVSSSCVHPGGIKTNIAKTARVSDSVVAGTNRSKADATKEFEMTFFTTPEAAAKVIIKGIQRKKRRILIGADARVFDWFARLMPASYQAIFTAVVRMRSQAK